MNDSTSLVSSSNHVDEPICIDYILQDNYHLLNRIRREPLRTNKNGLRTWTGPWVTRHIWNEERKEAVRTLQQYAHNRRTSEVTGELIDQLNLMSENDALIAIYKLKNKPTIVRPLQIVRTSGNHQMDIKAILSTTGTFQTFEVKALLDSGCTGSCINQAFVEKH
ncbi:hypothetical protein AMATHDRAFT_156860 [Amanita thiersii Skay4041]|uniref:Uncharacterized protein n=1 Tax=Amanita thiersii Skay4041 TaxID=703135 RepID=A0A2A9NEE8_9AGAR|nr:hypothetical protein AMATHDRAFT_156860 [Amanita thiersii Skay4041]